MCSWQTSSRLITNKSQVLRTKNTPTYLTIAFNHLQGESIFKVYTALSLHTYGNTHNGSRPLNRIGIVLYKISILSKDFWMQISITVFQCNNFNTIFIWHCTQIFPSSVANYVWHSHITTLCTYIFQYRYPLQMAQDNSPKHARMLSIPIMCNMLGINSLYVTVRTRHLPSYCCIFTFQSLRIFSSDTGHFPAPDALFLVSLGSHLVALLRGSCIMLSGGTA